jgi:hypothetical protein
LVDPLPVSPVLLLLQKYLSSKLYTNLINYFSDDFTQSKKKKTIYIRWSRYKTELNKIDLKECSQELEQLLTSNEPHKDQVHLFHIDKNDQHEFSTEPTLHLTNKMIHKFLFHIYQRNILASIVKYILLKDIIVKCKLIEPLVTKKSTFFLTQQRLEELIFESVLVSFNGSNYDNYLICNDLILIMSQFKEKIRIFKKGASISTVFIKCKHNIPPLKSRMLKTSKTKKLHSKKKNTTLKNKKNLWPMHLFIKDIRNLLSANMSLDKVGKLFNLKVSKLCFPYEQATSIMKIKNILSLNPYDDIFWTDNFSGKTINLETRLEAQTIFEINNFKNLYEYGTHYLIQDCLLLHSILLTMFKTYLNDSINIFIRRNYSQSSLAFQQFYIIEPSKQTDKTLAPKKINHPFYNYFIKQSTTGGLCTSFVHGTVGKNINCPINEHFKYLEKPILDYHKWPNFNNVPDWKNSFVEKASGINTIDIRSLYPSASVKKIPVGIPLFYTRITPDSKQFVKDSKVLKSKHWDINNLCNHVREKNECHKNNSYTFAKDEFELINNSPKIYSEYQALMFFLQNKLPKNITVLKFQSQFTALGQFYFGIYPVDGFISFLDENKSVHVKVIQYNSVFFHGHRNTCPSAEGDINSYSKIENTQKVKKEILTIWDQFSKIFHLKFIIQFEYVEIYDCDFAIHKIPNFKPFLNLKTNYSYSSFLDNILTKKISGLIVVKDLEINSFNQNPIFGFIIQKAQYGFDKLSPYTQEQIQTISDSKRVIGMHKCKGYMVINTEYFLWLYNTFGFKSTPDIYHALCFQLDDYLRKSIETKLTERSNIKSLIKNETNPNVKQNLEIKAELIKLLLNSSYGYTLCNLTSEKFKQFENKFNPPNAKNYSKVKTCVKLNDSTYLIECKKSKTNVFETMLGHVGSYILFQSKIILLKRLYFLLKYLNPTKAQLLYMDTDSAHFLLKHKEFIDNVDTDLQPEFQTLFPKHFDSGSKISGIWVHENFFENAEYLGEKSYRLFNDNHEEYITHMKGLNSNFQQKFHTQNICPKKYPVLSYNIFFKSPDFVIFKTHMSKNLFKNFCPIKRYFVSCTGSLPLKL